MELETWDTVIPGGSDFTSKQFHEWKAEVLQILDMSEHQLRKLYKMHFTPADIQANKHWAVYPPDRKTRLKQAIGMGENQPRGRRLSEKRKFYLYAKACRDVADGILTYHSLEIEMRAAVKIERAHFDSVMKANAHVGAARKVF